MSRLRDLIKETPRLAGCVDADRFADRNLLVFDKEIAEPGSIYSYRATDIDQDRLSVLEIPDGFINNENGYACAMRRVRISMWSHDKAKGRLTERQQVALDFDISASKKDIDDGNVDELAVEAIFPLEMAVKDVWK